jgi:hypothetical protein
MNYKTKVEGLPFCTETGIEIEWELIDKTKNSLVIMMKS